MKYINNFAVPDNETVMKESYEASNIQKVIDIVKQKKNTKLAIDCGAHIGVWSKKLAQHFDQVKSFEPVPRHYECFRHNLRDFDNVELYTDALGAKGASAVDMKLCLYNTGRSSMESMRVKRKITTREEMIKVDVITLDMLMIKDIDFIKIDVEGFEQQLLHGARNTLEHNSPIIYMEDFKRANNNPDNAGAYLEQLGYTEINAFPGHLGPKKLPNYLYAKINQ